jgi:hypothetical protein
MRVVCRSLFLAAIALLSLAAVPFVDHGSAVFSPQPSAVTFSVSDHAFDGPDAVSAGLTAIRLHNRGTEPHQVQLLRLTEGKTLHDLSDALRTSPGELPSWARPTGGPNGVEAGQTSEAILYLEPGLYALICAIPTKGKQPHAALGMQKALRVVEHIPAPPAFLGDIHIAMYEFEFVVVEPIRKGAHTFFVVNRGTQVHQLNLVRLEEDASAADVLAAYSRGTPASSPGKLLGGMAGLEPGGRGLFTASLEPGRYAMMCLFPNPTSHENHSAKGMVLQFSVE